MIFSLCFQIILSISLSFLLHAFNLKKHLHFFFTLLTPSNSTDNNNHNLHHSISSIKKPVIPLPPPPMTTLHEMQVDDHNEYCWRTKPAEGDVYSNSFPPPLSSLDGNGQRNFVLLPTRKDGRLQLYKVKLRRPEIMVANRQNGRLRLYIVRDQYIEDDLEYLQDECEEEELLKEEESTVVETESESESELESEEEMVEDSRYEYEEDDRVRECNNQNNERYRRRCHHHQLVNHIHGSHNNLLMYGVSIA